MSDARRFTVKGRVQGVFFRDSTRKMAATLGLTGHAINLPNGDVEVLACGDPENLNALQAWLWQGPPLSRVTDVQAESADVSAPSDFTTA